jgi:hypothetical protein
MSEKREISRAEQVRARRALRASQETASTSLRPVRPFTTHVTTRVGTTYVQPKHKRVEDNTRRFNIPLGLSNLSLHKPVSGVRQFRGSWRPASFLLSIMFGGMIYLASTLPYFQVPAVTVLGNNRLSREEITAVLGVTGESIFQVQPADIATRLRLNYAELETAQVNVYLPNYVYVTVSERQPLIVWQQGDGFTWIDAQGVAFRPHGQVNGLITVIGLAPPPSGVPSLNDPLNPPAFMEKELVNAILVLAPNVPAGSTLSYDPNEGLGWKDPRGWKVFFGTNTQNMPLKLHVYQSLVDSLAGSGKVPEYINVAYPDAPYYRMTAVSGNNPSVGTGQ